MNGQPDIIQNLSRLYPRLSSGQQKVAAYIIHHNDHAAFMTLAELAEATGVSKSTVERVARQALRYDSFYSFRAELQQALRATFEPGDKIQATAGAASTGADVLNRTLHEDIGNLEHTLKSVSADSFDAVVRRLASAERIFLYGRGVSRAVATLLKVRLSLLHPDVHLVDEDSGNARRRLLWLEPGDVVIFISFLSYSQETVNDAAYAASRGAFTVALTDRVTSPLVEHAREYLLIGAGRSSAMVSSLAPAMSVADALITSLIQTHPGSAERMRSLTERDIEYLNSSNVKLAGERLRGPGERDGGGQP